MSSQSFTISVEVDMLMTEFIPKLAEQFLAIRGTVDELSGTTLSLGVDVSGSRYSYSLKDGRHLEVRKGDVENPMVFLSIPVESMARLADMRNIDMLLGAQGQISGNKTRDKYAMLSGLKGTCVFKLADPEGEAAVITATFNGAATPAATFKLAMADARDLTARKESPIQLFMNGRLQIEGEMAFAMMLQPLFS